MYKFKAYTDGACSGNPGIGGWGVVLLAEKNNEIIKRKELSGGSLETTNNQMELKAAIETLKALKKPTEITIITDSNYVKKGITEWLSSWKKNNWKTSSKTEVKNKKLWEELEKLVNKNKVDWLWVKGHDGNVENEQADFLARMEIKKIKLYD
ncbi:MAG: ribonuclease HI [Paracoccaceae bacterium]|tara:strand:- start:1226 stop:1684 length:459 start_codon:yes stop_codon:yes gene_type:complete